MCAFFLGDSMDERKIIDILIKLAKKSAKKGDFPVSALIIKDDKIISKAINSKEYKKNAINHAELIAIDKACKKLKTWHLEECILYTTMEPCIMCYGAVLQSRIKKIVYIASNSSFGTFTGPYSIKNEKIEVKIIKNDEYINLIKQFFVKKRNNVSRETLEK